MVKSESEVKVDVMKMCDWVEKSYHLPAHLFQNEFSRMLSNFEKEMVKAKTSEEYSGLVVGVERTLVGMAERHNLNSEEVMQKLDDLCKDINRKEGDN